MACANGAMRPPPELSTNFTLTTLVSGLNGPVDLQLPNVGQDSFEEVDLLQKGGNFGWNTMEGLHCFNPSGGAT